MEKECQKCGHSNPNATGHVTEACPACGAIYRKVELQLAKAQQVLADEQAKQQAHAERWTRRKDKLKTGVQAASKQAELNRLARQHICTDCGHLGHPKRKAKGSLMGELLLWGTLFVLGVLFSLLTLNPFLWILFLVPGLAYSLWRQASKYRACPACGHTSMIPVKSPRGGELVNQFHPQSPLAQ